MAIVGLVALRSNVDGKLGGLGLCDERGGSTMVAGEQSAADFPAVLWGGLRSVDCPGSASSVVVRANEASNLSVGPGGQVGQPGIGGPSDPNACKIGV